MAVLKCMELLPKEKAKQLDDPLRRPKPNGYTYETLCAAAKELYSIDSAYDGNNSGGSKGNNSHQNATWSGDRRMAQTPLAGLMSAPTPAGGNRNKSVPPGFGGGGGDGGGAGASNI